MFASALAGDARGARELIPRRDSDGTDDHLAWEDRAVGQLQAGERPGLVGDEAGDGGVPKERDAQVLDASANNLTAVCVELARERERLAMDDGDVADGVEVVDSLGRFEAK